MAARATAALAQACPTALAERLARRSPQRIVVVQTAFLGDTVFTSALVQSLRVRFPEAALDLCVTPRGRDVALAIPGVAEALLFDKRGADAGLAGLWRAALRLRRRSYDLAVLPHRSLRTALLARTAGVPERLGFRGAAGSLFSTALAPDLGETFIDREAQLSRALGALPQSMRLVPTPASLEAARGLLASMTPPFAALCVGSEWETKIWPAPHLAALARSLRARGFTPILLGGPRERALAAEVQSAAPDAACLDTTGNPVGEAVALLSLCALCAGGDTGLVHAARALGVPTVAVFGPTAPEAHHFGPRERAVSLRLACSPCSAHGSRRCPLGHHDCLRTLGHEPVLQACMAALEQA